MTLSRSRGFTLIELLVVIAIIGILSAVILISLNDGRASARDARRIADLRQTQLALELYYNDFGVYPVASYFWPGDANGHTASGEDAYIPGLSPDYMPVLPQEPLGGQHGSYGYFYHSPTGEEYKFFAYNTPEGDYDSTHPFYDPVRTGWMVCSGEPACSTY